MAIEGASLRRRTLDDINVMRDDALRRPENLINWRAMLCVLQEEAFRYRRNKRKELSPRKFKAWNEGYSIYCKAILDRIQEAKQLIKVQNIKVSTNRKHREHNMMFKAIADAIYYIEEGRPQNARGVLEMCLTEIGKAEKGEAFNL